MSYKDEGLSIEKRFEDNFTAAEILIDNADDIPTEGTEHVALKILNGDGSIISATNTTRLERNFGIIDIGVFTPWGIGTTRGRELADLALAVFSGESFDGIVCRGGSVTRVGKSGSWFQYTVTIPFQRDEIF